MVHVVWFKRDLRTLDHAPLVAASLNAHVLPLYVVEPSYWQHEDLSGRHFQFVKESLIDLDKRLHKLGNSLYIYHGEMIECLKMLKDHYQTFVLHSHMEHGLTHTYERDLNVKAWMAQEGLSWHEYPHFGVLRGRYVGHRPTFMKSYLSSPIINVPKGLNSVKSVPTQLSTVDSLNRLEYGSDLAPRAVKGGETQAIKTAQAFFDQRFKKYQVSISKPSESYHSSSLLSAYIAWGNVSIKALHQSTQKHLKDLKQHDQKFLSQQLRAFESRLYWHCHFVEKIEMKPWLHLQSKDPRYDGVRQNHPVYLNAFKEGKTGFPFVDACIHFLHQTGWINFKQRAMLVSFACNTLLLDWREVGLFLAREWIDYEPGIHWSQIQMQSGLIKGRHIPIYDVIKQSKETDPEGIFIKENIPALKNVNSTDIHEPWKLENNPYITPIVDYETLLKSSKELLYGIKKT